MVTGELSGKPDEMLWAYLRWTGIPSKGSNNIPTPALHTTENWISFRGVVRLARVQTWPSLTINLLSK